MISIEIQSDHAALLKGTIEHFEATQCKTILSDCIQAFSGGPLQLDLSGLGSVSSIALSFLLFGLRASRQASCELHYKNMPPALFNMARVSGIENILTDKQHLNDKD